MIGDDPKVPDGVLLNAINGVMSADSIRTLNKFAFSVLNFKYGGYHHIPAIGSYDFKNTNQYWSFRFPEEVEDYFKKKGSHGDPIMKYVFSKARPFWLSDLSKTKDQKAKSFQRRLRLALDWIGDGIVLPLFGPNHKMGYVYVRFHHPKAYYDEIFIWQIQNFLQATHTQYCVITESFRETVKLTNRENEVLELISFGLTNSEIAEALKISPNTVAWYIKQIYLKLDVTDRVQAAMRAQNHIILGAD